MDIRTQSALLASIIGLALGVSMLLRPARPKVLTLYSVFALTVAGYYLSFFFHSLFPAATYPWAARITLGITVLVASLVPGAAVGFFLEFLDVSKGTHQVGRRLALLSVFLGLAVAVTPLADKVWARVAMGVWVLGSLLASVSLLLHRVRTNESRIEQLRLMYLAIGAAAGILFSALDFLGTVIPLPTLGPVFTTLYLFFLAQTLLRLRLMDLHELLGKIASQTVLAVILAAVFTVLTAWVDEDTGLFVFNTVVAAFVILILLDPLRTKVEEMVVRIFFRERFALLDALGMLRARMANVIDISELARLVLDTLHETGRVTHASVYLLAEDRPGYRLLDSRGPLPVSFLDTAAARGLLFAVASGQKAVLLENVERRGATMRLQSVEGRRYRDELKRLNDTRAALVQMKAGISVPMVGNDRVIGFLNLWDERVPEAYASDEIALILEVAEKLATVLENSKLYEKIRERDRLAALGEMAAGLAHEIRNPLGAIKGAAQCLDPMRLPGEDGEFLEVIVEEVNRLNGVVTAFLDYARPMKQSFGPTDLNEVVTRTMRLIQNDVPANVQLAVELDLLLPRADGDAEQLKQVLINLVQNAVQALDTREGRITVRTEKPERFGEFRNAGGEVLEVRVSDNGPGIPSDQQPHIFVPFFTTKQKGTGLGLAICQRIVKNHGGSISVQSKASEGTTFIIRLPALPAEKPAEGLVAEGTGTPPPATRISQSFPMPEELREPPAPSAPEPRPKRERRRRAS
ncbi:histidine kinase [Myxococcus llanfairpwllgwyngyllgogerychwyrndrobwllllantysiliogogogochensis]|uniref:histidine kinase n=1 Tax=Myxococcus llanfairpwllgwyngyllgogerychwyrndrobwllllantysiliogogogochensis TaxID=2590453 RepID=A0A540WIU5_9BACT|nr:MULTISPECIES: ATP-binding protein [Myxococcus]NTX58206.1 GAF domain-containing protein [Myxococcus sp. CA039A]TQF08930.1 histidine kinase [Myxococcus llanfairpwllgwyngyllgogerychwyrndrobwllllantysiliogogogochensis]